MMAYAEYLPGVLAGASIPTQLLIGPTQAWILLLSLLALCGGVLWFLTKPLGARSGEGAHSPTGPGPGGRGHPVSSRGWSGRAIAPPALRSCQR